MVVDGGVYGGVWWCMVVNGCNSHAGTKLLDAEASLAAGMVVVYGGGWWCVWWCMVVYGGVRWCMVVTWLGRNSHAATDKATQTEPVHGGTDGWCMLVYAGVWWRG